MKKLLFPGIVFAAMSSAALAAEPLTEKQMDTVTAGQVNVAGPYLSGRDQRKPQQHNWAGRGLFHCNILRGQQRLIAERAECPSHSQGGTLIEAAG